MVISKKKSKPPQRYIPLHQLPKINKQTYQKSKPKKQVSLPGIKPDYFRGKIHLFRPVHANIHFIFRAIAEFHMNYLKGSAIHITEGGGRGWGGRG